MDNDDAARDIRALTEDIQAQLLLLDDGNLSITDQLLILNIQATTALTLALARNSGVLDKRTSSANQMDYTFIAPLWATVAATNTQMTVNQLAEVLREMEKRVPDWETKKIQAIKEVRALTHLGLKEAKDILDAAWDHRPDYWWRTP